MVSEADEISFEAVSLPSLSSFHGNSDNEETIQDGGEASSKSPWRGKKAMLEGGDIREEQAELEDGIKQFAVTMFHNKHKSIPP